MKQLGQCNAVERHIQHFILMNESHCFVSEAQKWKKYKRDSKGKFYQYENEDEPRPEEFHLIVGTFDC